MLRLRPFVTLPALGLLVLAGLLAPLAAQEGVSEQTGSQAPPKTEDVVFRLDPDASEVTFTLGATLHTVEGSFAVSRGMVRFDPESGEASGEIVVDVTTGDTGREGRDEDMHAKVLESQQFPQAIFTPTRVEGSLPESGSGQVTLHGTLRLHGSSHELSIPADVTVQDNQVDATGTFQVPYVDWGMEDPSRFLLRVDKHVDVRVAAVGSLER